MESNPGIIQWGKPESVPAYGHSQLQHGEKVSLQSLKDRARGTEDPQGQFYDDMFIVEAERRMPKTPAGIYIVEFDDPDGIGRVVRPDGVIIENVTKVLVVRKPTGTVRTSYPITDQYAEYLINRDRATFISD